ncbi:uncharacterized protein PAC_09253 [Phialocephala subalpina]|uniref:Uncharacterized protein n=1 Tax=Phialocephala subalpina TaxID=576137 RepID=A0A1L7X2X1_9HELO|nr:uncharacterized protein PAC_09253 [Phialocephala subalpina]
MVLPVPAASARQNMGRQTSSSLGTPAPYGQARTNCAQSNSKCIIRLAGGCERRRRLKKECRLGEKVRRRSLPKPAASKITPLEEKLDGLVSLIKDGAQANTPIHS